MNTVFVGGSRHVSRLSGEARERLRNVTDLKAQILVGDANGADKAVQKLLHDDGYAHVTVYCSGHQCRNNLGGWPTESIEAPAGAKGFDFYAAKDRVMARNADYGLMIWDGKSPGTVLNILRARGRGLRHRRPRQRGAGARHEPGRERNRSRAREPLSLARVRRQFRVRHGVQGAIVDGVAPHGRRQGQRQVPRRPRMKLELFALCPCNDTRLDRHSVHH
jgi:hypothetical protein